MKELHLFILLNKALKSQMKFFIETTGGKHVQLLSPIFSVNNVYWNVVLYIKQ